MVKSKLCLFLLMIFLSSISLFAQQENFQKQLEKTIDLADRTATFENGKIKSVKILVDGEGEKLINFEHSTDGRSFTIIDEHNARIQVFSEKGKISSIKMPDSGQAIFQYVQTDGVSIFNDLTFNYANNLNVPIRPRNGNPCRDALVAIGVAAGLCAVTPGSAGCWAATATAGYHTYRCYESTR
jgi:hypothetical protein